MSNNRNTRKNHPDYILSQDKNNNKYWKRREQLKNKDHAMSYDDINDVRSSFYHGEDEAINYSDSRLHCEEEFEYGTDQLHQQQVTQEEGTRSKIKNMIDNFSLSRGQAALLFVVATTSTVLIASVVMYRFWFG